LSCGCFESHRGFARVTDALLSAAVTIPVGASDMASHSLL